MSEGLKKRLQEVKLDGNLLNIENVKRGISVPVDNLRVDKSKLSFRFNDSSSFHAKIKGGEWSQAILIDNREKISSKNFVSLASLNFVLLLILYLLFPGIIAFWKVLLIPIFVSALFIISHRTLYRYGILYRK